MSDSSSASGPSSGEWRARLEVIQGLARRLSPDRETAEEAASEVVYRLVATRVPVRRFSAWAFQALRHLVGKWLRERQERESGEEVEPDSLPAREETGVYLRIVADEVLSGLKPPHAEILRLYREGLSRREIADRMGFPEAQVSARLARAQRAARKVLDAAEQISPTAEYKRPSKSLYRK